MEKRNLVAWCGLLLSSNHLVGELSGYVISVKALRFFWDIGVSFNQISYIVGLIH